MPIYEYRCQKCGRVSEVFVRSAEGGAIRCPLCGSERLERLVSASYMIRTDASGQALPAAVGTAAVIPLRAPRTMSATEHKVLKGATMRIAAVSDDGVTISQHFGRAPYYVVITVEDGKVTAKETRRKAGHHTFAAHQPPKVAPGERHGYDEGSQSRHASMAEAISDCQVVLAGGMGWGAYEAMQGYGIQPVVTDVRDIDEAVELHLAGRLHSLIWRLH